MTFKIERANPQRDYAALARFLSAFEPDPISATQIHEWDQRLADSIVRRSIVRGGEAAIHGYSVALHSPWEPEGRFYLWVGVEEAQRRQGLGNLLYEDALRFIRSQHGTEIRTAVNEPDAAGLRFAQARGFSITTHTFASTLNLHSFDEGRFAGIVDALERAGIRFFSLADVGDTEEARRQLYDLNYRAVMDDPGSDGSFPPFEQFSPNLDIASWFRAEGQILAADGDRYVGLSAVGYFAESNMMYNMITGVDPDYRGRGIAQALKVLTIRYAKACGADYIRTNNNSRNAPMLAINCKLGYQPQPGIYDLSRRIS